MQRMERERATCVLVLMDVNVLILFFDVRYPGTKLERVREREREKEGERDHASACVVLNHLSVSRRDKSLRGEGERQIDRQTEK